MSSIFHQLKSLGGRLDKEVKAAKEHEDGGLEVYSSAEALLQLTQSLQHLQKNADAVLLSLRQDRHRLDNVMNVLPRWFEKQNQKLSLYREYYKQHGYSPMKEAVPDKENADPSKPVEHDGLTVNENTAAECDVKEAANTDDKPVSLEIKPFLLFASREQCDIALKQAQMRAESDTSFREPELRYQQPSLDISEPPVSLKERPEPNKTCRNPVSHLKQPSVACFDTPELPNISRGRNPIPAPNLSRQEAGVNEPTDIAPKSAVNNVRGFDVTLLETPEIPGTKAPTMPVQQKTDNLNSHATMSLSQRLHPDGSPLFLPPPMSGSRLLQLSLQKRMGNMTSVQAYNSGSSPVLTNGEDGQSKPTQKSLASQVTPREISRRLSRNNVLGSARRIPVETRVTPQPARRRRSISEGGDSKATPVTLSTTKKCFLPRLARVSTTEFGKLADYYQVLLTKEKINNEIDSINALLLDREKVGLRSRRFTEQELFTGLFCSDLATTMVCVLMMLGRLHQSDDGHYEV